MIANPKGMQRLRQGQRDQRSDVGSSCNLVVSGCYNVLENLLSKRFWSKVNCVIRNVIKARTIVTAIFPVTLAPNGINGGIRPIILLIRMKKKTVNK